MMTTDERVTRVLRARQGGHVKRCHTVPHYGEYKVSEHTCQMLLLLDVLCPKATIRLLRAVLHHDLHEFYTGDVPGAIGRIDPELRHAFNGAGEVLSEFYGWAHDDLSDNEKRWLRAVDRLELLLWCYDQINMGNDHVSPMLDGLLCWFDDDKNDVPYAIRTFLNGFEWRRLSNGEL